MTTNMTTNLNPAIAIGGQQAQKGHRGMERSGQDTA
jgi:hypothetical protein